MRNWQRWIPAILIMAGICWLSSIPDLSLYDARALTPEMMQFIKKYTLRIGDKGFFSYVISPHPDYVLHKLGHIFGFGALGVTLYYAVGRSLKLAGLCIALFAASDELHQFFVPGRSSRFFDIVLDTLAAIVFIFVVRKIEKQNML